MGLTLAVAANKSVRSSGSAVAAQRRGAAFDASKWVVDELKKKVPIWKKPAFAMATAGKPHLTDMVAK